MFNEILVVVSEIALAFYPILIKTVPASLNTQLVSRFLTFTVLAAILAKPSALLQTWGTVQGALRSSGLGILTLAHVTTSYYAFKELPAAVAMSLFYTYPILNLLGGMAFFGESVSLSQVLLIATCFLGVLLISYGSGDMNEDGTKKQVNWPGILAAIGAALTETATYFAVRTAKVPDPFFAILELYPGALALMLGLLFATGTTNTLTMTSSAWLPMTIFNIVVGFLGNYIKFYTIPKVSTAIFSTLTFFGIVASFIFGFAFIGEVPNATSIMGAILITAASCLSTTNMRSPVKN